MTENFKVDIVIRGQKSSKGLLINFLKNKLEKYEEPSREGTPKGEPIGFPQMKYLASLLLLTNISLKDLSKSLKISYGVLRNWNSEPAFKKQIEENMRSISAAVIVPSFLSSVSTSTSLILMRTVLSLNLRFATMVPAPRLQRSPIMLSPT